MAKIVISPPVSSWSAEFPALRSLLAEAVPEGATIHHIGSTAVPNLAAKDVIDIQVSVDALDGIDAARLEKVGFRQVRGLLSDHCPPGVALDDAELAKLFFKGTTRAANVHIRERGASISGLLSFVAISCARTRLPQRHMLKSSGAWRSDFLTIRMPITKSRTRSSTSLSRGQTNGPIASAGLSPPID